VLLVQKVVVNIGNFTKMYQDTVTLVILCKNLKALRQNGRKY